MKKIILDNIEDLVSDLLYYNRKGDEDLDANEFRDYVKKAVDCEYFNPVPELKEEFSNEMICDECEEPILEGELSCIYDGKYCHADCAARVADECDFDNWLDNRD